MSRLRDLARRLFGPSGRVVPPLATDEPTPDLPLVLARLRSLVQEREQPGASREALRQCVEASLAREAAQLVRPIAIAPGAPAWVRLLHAEALLHVDDDLARETLDLLADDPETAAQAYLRLGDLARDSGDHAVALSHYERSLAFDFSSPRARMLADELRASLRPGASSSHPTLALPKDRLGPAAQRYRLLRELGRGGAGAVYLAEDLRLGRRVAIKVLHPEGRDQKAAMNRMLAEARGAAALAHPGVIRIFDLDPERRLIIMEHLAGGSLRDRMPPGEPLPPTSVAALGAALCEVLAAVHARGILHGDVKPANILFRRDSIGLDEPVLADFGIARVQGLDNGLRSAGTLLYMPPELRRDGSVDVRGDLYSVGVVLHEALSGTRPFDRKDLLQTETPRPPPLSDVPPALGKVVASLMAARPDQRPDSALRASQQLREALR